MDAALAAVENLVMKICPFRKERVHEDALKCRYCQSALAPIPQGSTETTSFQITYIIHSGFIKFSKFAGAGIAEAALWRVRASHILRQS